MARRVESEVRQGSAFHFTVRVRALPAAQRRMLPDNVQEALEKKRVLLIAGIAHAGSTKMLEQLLRGWKMRPLPVETGADALDLVSAPPCPASSLPGTGLWRPPA